MITNIYIPSPGESITEVEIANWFVSTGDFVEKNQEIAEIESDKATLSLIAEVAGIIEIKIEKGSTAKVGAIACSITVAEKQKEIVEATIATENKPEKKELPQQNELPKNAVKITPVAKNLMQKYNFTLEDILTGIKRIDKNIVEDVATAIKTTDKPKEHEIETTEKEQVSRERMSLLRRNLSKRLVSVKNETAMLTTFNEVDMSTIINLRQKNQKEFSEKHGIKLGFMSFFTKAAATALQLHPNINAMIDGEDILFNHTCNIGIAVQTPRGLMVPVVKHVENMTLAQIEAQIFELAQKGRAGKISIEELNNGTFTITNGGIFGSMLSTPILNPPQSAILGMHNIIERPVAIAGKVEIRPMMYLALSYDHRIIDGQDSVGFLLKIKQMIENPYKIITQGIDPEKMLLNL